jgi:peptidoglycan/LPS O-acetylase OafA/YrhL
MVPNGAIRPHAILITIHGTGRLVAIRLSSNLDLLRAVAVILVLVQHLLNRFYFFRMGLTVPPVGTFGVLIFFVHTCLVLMYSMQRSGLQGLPLALNFYTRRFFRIYPLSVVAVLTAVTLHLDSDINGLPGLSRVSTIPWGRIASNLLLVQNMVKPGSIINVLWSLPYEVQMYVFLPPLFLWITRTKLSPRMLLVTWSASLFLAIGHMHLPWSGFMAISLQRLSIVRYVPNFLPGVIAFTLRHVPRFKSWLWLPFILVLITIYACFPGIGMGWVLCLILGCAIPSFAEITTPWLRWISNRIATYSYGIYLTHQFSIWFVSDPLHSVDVWIRAVILIALLVGLPVLLYHTIEKPMIAVGVHVANGWNTKLLPDANN